MVGVVGKAVAALGLAGAALLAVNVASVAGPDTATFAVTGAETSVPYGWLDFCERYRAECQPDAQPAQEVKLTHAAMRKIVSVNGWVNNNVEPVADKEHSGAIDRWDFPTDGLGDCEDYALLKRQMLVAEGFPRAALLMTVVKEKNGDGHSVLTVKTDHGDFVLDNLSDKVKPWDKTPYRFVKRQSQQDQNVWVAIADPAQAAYAAR